MRNFVLLFIVFTLLSCSSKVYNKTRWQDNIVNIDGKATEWEVPLQYFDKTTQLNYQFYNDNKNLYFIARTFDELTIRQILLSGLKLEVDTCLKNDEFPFSLAYPVMSIKKMDKKGGPPGGFMPDNKNTFPGTTNDDIISEQDALTMDDRPQINSEKTERLRKIGMNRNDFLETQPELIELYGFNNLWEEEVLSFSETKGIKALLTADSALYYEAVIPFETFYRKNLQPNDTLAVFRFRISMENFERPKFGPNGNPDGEARMSRPMGAGGRPPGGGPGGMGGPPPGGGKMGSPPDRIPQKLSKDEKCEINLKLYLSYKKAN